MIVPEASRRDLSLPAPKKKNNKKTCVNILIKE